MNKGKETKEVKINIGDFLPLYGLLMPERYGISIDGKNTITVAELFEKHPETELDEDLIETLNSLDRFSFQHYINTLNNEALIINFIRQRFNDYKQEGGNPLEWINKTLSDMEVNSFNYPELFQGTIQTNLIEWANYYEKIKGTETTTTGTLEPEQETTEQKIKRILEPIRGAFADETHIENIVEAIVKSLDGEPIPKENKKPIIMKMEDFIKPFGELIENGLVRRGEISRILKYYIKKSTSGDPDYSEGYLLKLLSGCKSTPF